MFTQQDFIGKIGKINMHLACYVHVCAILTHAGTSPKNALFYVVEN